MNLKMITVFDSKELMEYKFLIVMLYIALLRTFSADLRTVFTLT